mgnify:CR=1 FL=1
MYYWIIYYYLPYWWYAGMTSGSRSSSIVGLLLLRLHVGDVKVVIACSPLLSPFFYVKTTTLIIIIESSWGHFKLSVRVTNLTNTSIIAANYQQIIRMICQFCRSIQLMIIMWHCHSRCCRRCRYRNSSLTTWRIARRWRRWPANGHNFKSNEHKCDENCRHDAYKVRRWVLCISDN